MALFEAMDELMHYSRVAFLKSEHHWMTWIVAHEILEIIINKHYLLLE